MSMEATATFRIDVMQAVDEIMAYLIHITEKNLTPTGKLCHSVNIDYTGGLTLGRLYGIKTLLLGAKDELPEQEFKKLVVFVEDAIVETMDWGKLARSSRAGVGE